MNEIKNGCRLAALLVIATLIINWSGVFIPLQIGYYLRVMNGFAWLLVVMSLLFLTLNVTAAIGLYRMQWWGFVSAYVAIIFSTIFFSACYLPFFDRLFPVNYVGIALLIANTMVLVLVICLHVQVRKLQGHLPKARVQKPQRSKKKKV